VFAGNRSPIGVRTSMRGSRMATTSPSPYVTVESIHVRVTRTSGRPTVA
jgi:hypothetical protein